MSLRISCCCVFAALAAATAEAQEVKIFANSSQSTAHPVVVVEVPPGWSIIGGGASTNWNGTDPGNLLVSAYPLDERHWIASSKDHSVSSPAVLTAYAVAIVNPSQGYDVKIFGQRSSGASDLPITTASVAAGYQMTGGGAKADTEGAGLLLTASYPSGETSWVAAAKAHSVSSPGSVIAFAIGVKSTTSKPFPHVRRFASSVSGSSLAPQNTINVDASYIVTGGGAQLAWEGSVGCLLTETVPVGNFGWSGKGKAHSVPSLCTMSVFVMGIQGAVIRF